MDVWELNPEGRNRLGCGPLRLVGGGGGTFWLWASMIVGGEVVTIFFSYNPKFAFQLMESTEHISEFSFKAKNAKFV
jgi:hypothetical protein